MIDNSIITYIMEEIDSTNLSKTLPLEKCEELGIESGSDTEIIDNTEESIINIDNSSFDILKQYYDTNLNLDKTTYQSSNDEPTPIDCIIDMINKIPEELWEREDLSILDPCCGNGNFALPILFKLLHLWTFKTPTFALKKYKNVKSNLMVLLFLLLFGY